MVSQLRTVEHTGKRIDCFSDYFYEHIYVSPESVLFNDLIGGLSKSVVVFNAYRTTKLTCNFIEEQNTKELILDGLAPVFILRKLGYTYYGVELPERSTPAFAGAYIWHFGEVPNVGILRFVVDRLVLFSFPPEREFVEIMEWQTDVMRNRSGDEMRQIITDSPRHGISFRFAILNDRDSSQYDVSLHAWSMIPWMVPLWGEAVRINTVIQIDDTHISADMRYMDIQDGDRVVIWKSIQSYELVEVSEVTSTGFDVAAGIVNQYSGELYVIPCRVGHIVEKQVVERGQTFLVSEVGFRFEEMREISGYAAPATFQGIPMITEPPVFVDKSQGGELGGGVIVTDVGYGKNGYFSPQKYSEEAFDLGFTMDSKEEVWKFKQFLHYMKGQGNECFIPTFRKDLIPVANLAGTEIRVAPCEFTKGLFGSPLAKYLFISYGDPVEVGGKVVSVTNVRYVIREIVDASGESGYENLTLTEAFAETIDYRTAKISFLKRCRLAADRAEIEWLDFGEAECTLKFKGVSHAV